MCELLIITVPAIYYTKFEILTFKGIFKKKAMGDKNWCIN